MLCSWIWRLTGVSYRVLYQKLLCSTQLPSGCGSMSCSHPYILHTWRFKHLGLEEWGSSGIFLYLHSLSPAWQCQDGQESHHQAWDFKAIGQRGQFFCLFWPWVGPQEAYNSWKFYLLSGSQRLASFQQKGKKLQFLKQVWQGSTRALGPEILLWSILEKITCHTPLEGNVYKVNGFVWVPAISTVITFWTTK